MSQEVVSFKLVSGEEIIARKVELTADTLVIEKPRHILMQQTGPGQVGIALIPWFGSAGDSEIKIWRNTIVAHTDDEDVVAQIKQMYIQQTTGLDLSASTPSQIVGV